MSNQQSNTITFTIGGYTLRFYKDDGDEKYRFLIEGEEALTAKLLATTSAHRVKKDSISYAAKAIFHKIATGNFQDLPAVLYEGNPITELAEKCQRIFRDSILTEVLDVSGPDHNPQVTVCITLPNGDTFTEVGSNQKLAKRKAALLALVSLSTQ